MKAILAHMLVHYEFRMADGELPREQWFGHSVIPHQTATVLFRRR